jgi:hypothetical protein
MKMAVIALTEMVLASGRGVADLTYSLIISLIV